MNKAKKYILIILLIIFLLLFFFMVNKQNENNQLEIQENLILEELKSTEALIHNLEQEINRAEVDPSEIENKLLKAEKDLDRIILKHGLEDKIVLSSESIKINDYLRINPDNALAKYKFLLSMVDTQENSFNKDIMSIYGHFREIEEGINNGFINDENFKAEEDVLKDSINYLIEKHELTIVMDNVLIFSDEHSIILKKLETKVLAIDGVLRAFYGDDNYEYETINNEAIRELFNSFRSVFDYLYEQAEPEEDFYVIIDNIDQQINGIVASYNLEEEFLRQQKISEYIFLNGKRIDLLRNKINLLQHHN